MNPSDLFLLIFFMHNHFRDDFISLPNNNESIVVFLQTDNSPWFTDICLMLELAIWDFMDFDLKIVIFPEIQTIKYNRSTKTIVLCKLPRKVRIQRMDFRFADWKVEIVVGFNKYYGCYKTRISALFSIKFYQ